LLKCLFDFDIESASRQERVSENRYGTIRDIGCFLRFQALMVT